MNAEMNRIYLARKVQISKAEDIYKSIKELYPHLTDKPKLFMKAYLDKLIDKEEYDLLKSYLI